MKLRELFGYTGEGQTIALTLVGEWRITAQAYAMERCLNDDVLEGTITGINANGSDLVVSVDCEYDD